MESPSRRVHNETLEHLRILLAAARSRDPGLPGFAEDINALERERQQKVDFFDQNQQHFGKLLCGSGFQRTKLNHRVDWALIQVNNNRIGENVIPGREAWPEQLDPDISRTTRRLKGMQAIASGRDTETATKRVFMVGAKSGPIVGYLNHISCRVKLPWDLWTVPSQEKEFSREYGYILATEVNQFRISNEPFGQPGDSGGFVFSSKGEWMGLLHAGGKAHTDPRVDDTHQKMGYVTDVQDLMEDFEEFQVKVELCD